MSKYLIITILSKNKDKQAILHNFFDDVHTSKDRKGLLLKFNNSLGFKDVAWQIKNHGYYKEDIKTPENYVSPVEILLDSMYWLNKKNEVVTFILPVTEMKFGHKHKFNYSTLELGIRFQSFLNKVYRDNIKVELELGDKPKLSLKEKVLSHIYCVTAEGEHFSCEMSMPRKLKNKELKYILDIMKDYVSFVPVIDQYECEVCKSY